jgi:glycerol-3-phosphate dehydrogenase (NAD(P)+)
MDDENLSNQINSSASNNAQITVIGNGSWATALIKIILDNSNSHVTWWMRDAETADYISCHGHNPKYLSSVEFDTTRITTTSTIETAVEASNIIILAVPSAFLHSVIQGITLPQNKIYVSAIKGIEPNSKRVIAEYLSESHQIELEQVVLISGPCHAEEVALEKLSYLTVSGFNLNFVNQLADILCGKFIKVSTTQDLIGAEYASVLKNIYAIGAGIAHGLGYGDNFQAVYVAAAIREMKSFLHEIHQDERDVKEAAYLGDLLVTCYSQFSRNRSFGNMLGKGYSVKSAQLEMNMIAEGYYATDLVYQMAKNMNFQMPIVESIHQVVYQNAIPRKIFKKLSEEELQ